VIKYIGSKRRLVPAFGEMFAASGARTALDLFTGTTRVAQEMKRRGMVVTAVDSARYAEVFAQCWIETDAGEIDRAELESAIDHLQHVPGEPGYVTDTFCVQSRFFQPHNGERIDAIRDAIDRDFATSRLRPMLLTSLLLAADRVDSTAGVQMAYIKSWAPRSYQPLALRVPELLEGRGRAVRGDAAELAGALGSFDLAYVDPPYNQHRYFTNYHIYETLVAWDRPAHYGVACKRVDSRAPETKSVFNEKRRFAEVLGRTIAAIDARVLMLSYNNEAWVALADLLDMCSGRGHVEAVALDARRYIGAQIGIHSPTGEKVGSVSHVRNLEYVVVAGPRADVERMVSAATDAGLARASL